MNDWKEMAICALIKADAAMSYDRTLCEMEVPGVSNAVWSALEAAGYEKVDDVWQAKADD